MSLTTAALAFAVAACQQSSPKAPAPPPLHAQADKTPTATGKAQSVDATVVAWTQQQTDEMTVQCLQAAPGDTSPQRQPFCECLAKAASAGFSYDAYTKNKDDVYAQVERKAGEECAKQSGDALPGVVDDGTNLRHWTANDIAQATGRCTTDLPQLGLGLDAEVVSVTCACLLKPAMQTQPYGDFQKGLSTFIASQLTGGGLKTCLAKVGFAADAVKQRKWTQPVNVVSYDAGGLDKASATVDATGRLGAIWVLNDPASGAQLWARFTDKSATGGWAAAAKIGGSKAYIGTPRLVFGSDGGITAYWAEATGAALDTPAVFISRYDATTFWSQPAQVGGKAFAGASVGNFSFDVDQAGRVAVTYVQSGAATSVSVAQYTPADGWGATQTLQSPEAAGTPQLAVGTGGDLVVGWLAGTGLVTSGLQNGAWSAPNGNGPTIVGSGFELAIARPDHALAVWITADTAYHVTSARYTKLTGWQAPAPFASSPALANPHLVTSDNGAAVAAWIDASSGQRVVTGAAYHVFDGWLPPAAVSAPTGQIDSLKLVPAGSGRVLAVWTESTGGKSGKLWISAFE